MNAAEIVGLRCRTTDKCHSGKQCVYYEGHGGDHAFSGGSEIVKLRRALDDLEAERDQLSASEALYGFCGWLTTRPIPVTMGAANDCAVVASLVQEFCDTNNLPVPRDEWPKRCKHPKETTP